VIACRPINGVSLRVAAEDAGDGYMSSARMNRYRRELGKVSLGEDVELRVLSGGQSKTVKVKPVRAGDLPRDRNGVMIIGDGSIGIGDVFRVCRRSPSRRSRPWRRRPVASSSSTANPRRDQHASRSEARFRSNGPRKKPHAAPGKQRAT
jgi:hypothetical protein